MIYHFARSSRRPSALRRVRPAGRAQPQPRAPRVLLHASARWRPRAAPHRCDETHVDYDRGHRVLDRSCRPAWRQRRLRLRAALPRRVSGSRPFDARGDKRTPGPPPAASAIASAALGRHVGRRDRASGAPLRRACLRRAARARHAVRPIHCGRVFENDPRSMPSAPSPGCRLDRRAAAALWTSRAASRHASILRLPRAARTTGGAKQNRLVILIYGALQTDGAVSAHAASGSTMGRCWCTVRAANRRPLDTPTGTRDADRSGGPCFVLMDTGPRVLIPDGPSNTHQRRGLSPYSSSLAVPRPRVFLAHRYTPPLIRSFRPRAHLPGPHSPAALDRWRAFGRIHIPSRKSLGPEWRRPSRRGHRCR